MNLNNPLNSINNPASIPEQLSKDVLALKTAAYWTFHNATAGLNNIGNFYENLEDNIIKSPITGQGVWDYVKFSLSKDIFIGEYINSTISIQNNVEVSRTFINGNTNGSIKQLINTGDQDITIVLNIFSPFQIGDMQLDNNAQLNIKSGGSKKFGNYYPNDELKKIYNFFNSFWNNNTYQKVDILSGYLNNLGINEIIPYSISTGQNHSVTNSYSITIKAYTDTNTDDPFKLIMK
jgi:hypothetical protein